MATKEAPVDGGAGWEGEHGGRAEGQSSADASIDRPHFMVGRATRGPPLAASPADCISFSRSRVVPLPAQTTEPARAIYAAIMPQMIEMLQGHAPA